MYIYKLKLRDAYCQYSDRLNQLHDKANAGLIKIFTEANKSGSKELVKHIASNINSSKYWIDPEYCTAIIDILGEAKADYSVKLFEVANRLCLALQELKLEVMAESNASYDDLNRAFLAVMVSSTATNFEWLSTNQDLVDSFAFSRDFMLYYRQLREAQFDVMDCLGLTANEIAEFREALQRGDFNGYVVDCPSRLLNFLTVEAAKGDESEFGNLSAAVKERLLKWYLLAQSGEQLTLGTSLNFSIFGKLVDNAKVRDFLKPRRLTTSLILDNTAITDEIFSILTARPLLSCLSLRRVNGITFNTSVCLSLNNLRRLDITECSALQGFNLRMPKLWSLIMLNEGEERFNSDLIAGIVSYIRQRMSVDRGADRYMGHVGSTSRCYLTVKPGSKTAADMIRAMMFCVNQYATKDDVFKVRIHSEHGYILQLWSTLYKECGNFGLSNKFNSFMLSLIRGSHSSDNYQHLILNSDVMALLDCLPNRFIEAKTDICFDQMPSLDELTTFLSRAKHIRKIRYATKPAMPTIVLPSVDGVRCYGYDFDRGLFVIDVDEGQKIDQLHTAYAAIMAANGVRSLWNDRVSIEMFGSKTCYVIRDNGLIRALLQRGELTKLYFDISALVSASGAVALTDDIVRLFADRLRAYCRDVARSKTALTLDFSQLTSQLENENIQQLIDLLNDVDESYIQVSGIDQSEVHAGFIEQYLLLLRSVVGGVVSIGSGYDAISKLLLTLERCGLDAALCYQQFLQLLCPSREGQSEQWQQPLVRQVHTVIALLLTSNTTRLVLTDYMAESDANYSFVVNCLDVYLGWVSKSAHKDKALISVKNAVKMLFPNVMWQQRSAAIFALYAVFWLDIGADRRADVMERLHFIMPKWSKDRKRLSDAWFEIANVLAFTGEIDLSKKLFSAAAELCQDLTWGLRLSENGYQLKFMTTSNVPEVPRYPHASYFWANKKYMSLDNMKQYFGWLWRNDLGEGFADFIISALDEYVMQHGPSLSSLSRSDMELFFVTSLHLLAVHMGSDNKILANKYINYIDTFAALLIPMPYRMFYQYFLSLLNSESFPISYDRLLDADISALIFNQCVPVNNEERCYRVLALKLLYPKADITEQEYQEFTNLDKPSDANRLHLAAFLAQECGDYDLAMTLRQRASEEIVMMQQLLINPEYRQIYQNIYGHQPVICVEQKTDSATPNYSVRQYKLPVSPSLTSTPMPANNNLEAKPKATAQTLFAKAKPSAVTEQSRTVKTVETAKNSTLYID